MQANARSVARLRGLSAGLWQQPPLCCCLWQGPWPPGEGTLAVCGLSFRVELAYLSFRRNRAAENVPSTAPPSLREARLRPDAMVLTAL